MELIPKDASNNRQIKKHNSLINSYVGQNDFKYFKNELLKDLKDVDSKLSKRIQSSKEEFENRIVNIENKLNAIKEKLLENNKNSTFNEINKSINEKINNLFVFKEKIEEKMYNQEQQIKDINKQSSDSIYSLNKYIKENISYPEIIGYNGKFVSFRSFIDHILSSFDNLNSFKTKILEMDLQSYKVKLDKLIKVNKSELEQFISSSKKSAIDNIIVYDKKMNELIKIFESKLINEKKEYENQIKILNQKISDKINLFENNKIEIMNKIFENNNKINENRIKLEKYINDINNINGRIENINEINKKVKIEYEKKMNSLEYKLIAKISNLYTLMKNNNNEFNKKFNFIMNNEDFKSYNNNDDKLFIKNMSESKNQNNDPDSPQIKKSSSLSNRNLQKYMNEEFGSNELSFIKSEKKIIKEKDLNNDNDNDKNTLGKRKSNSNPNTLPNNIKYIKLNKTNSLLRKNKKKNDSKIFIDKKQINSYIMKSENTLLNIIPRREIINHVFIGNNDLINFFLKRNNIWKSPSNKKFEERIIKRAKIKQQLFKNNKDKLFKGSLINKSQSFYNKKSIGKNIFSSDDNKYLSKDEIYDNKRSNNSPLNNKNKKIEHFPLYSYNDTDNIKEQKNPDLNSQNKNNSSPSLSKLFKKIKSDIKIYDLNVEENRLININSMKNDKNNNKVMINQKTNRVNKNKVYKNLKSSSNYYLNLMINKDKRDLK